MESSDKNPQGVSLEKPGKGQFKCFHCRKIFAMKDGDWHAWKGMEVHLCKHCDKATATRPERKDAGR